MSPVAMIDDRSNLPWFSSARSSKLSGKNFSVSQYRLPKRKTSASSGKSCIECCCAEVATRSGAPESLTTAVFAILIRPLGATIRLHQLPKLSR
jgi:hypothetical protein